MSIKVLIKIAITTFLFLNFNNLRAIELPVDKGSVVASGGFIYDNYDKGKGTNFVLDGSLSRFFAPGFSFGVDLLYSRSTYKGSSTRTLVGIGPVLRYYWNLQNDRDNVKGAVYPYIGSSIHFSKSTSRYA